MIPVLNIVIPGPTVAVLKTTQVQWASHYKNLRILVKYNVLIFLTVVLRPSICYSIYTNLCWFTANTLASNARGDVYMPRIVSNLHCFYPRGTLDCLCGCAEIYCDVYCYQWSFVFDLREWPSVTGLFRFLSVWLTLIFFLVVLIAVFVDLLLCTNSWRMNQTF